MRGKHPVSLACVPQCREIGSATAPGHQKVSDPRATLSSKNEVAMANDLTGPEAGLSPIVEIALGKLRGARDRGVFAFKGVLYGAPASGRNRFKPPQLPQPWTGLRDAIAYAGHALQSPNRPKRRPELETLLGP